MVANPLNEAARVLPETLPIFPLPCAVVLPRQNLPLNIFEPRYLHMVLDALGAERVIGMIQPAAGSNVEPPALCRVGCAGRITSFQETGDGRLLINLTGLSRFEVRDELDLVKGYRRVRPDFSRFDDDLAPPPDDIEVPADFDATLQAYLDAKGIGLDWKQLEEVPRAHLVDLLAVSLPLPGDDKQLLLESPTLKDRARDLTAVLSMLTSAGAGDPSQIRH